MKHLNMKPVYIMLSIVALNLSACGGGSSSNTKVAASTQQQLQGLWEKDGYGNILSVIGNTVTPYDFTSETCVRHDPDALASIANKLDQVSNTGTEFMLRDASVGFIDIYSKIETLPVTCNSPAGDTPTEVFEHVWHTFNEYYAFFNERNVDWLSQYHAIRNQIHDGMSDEELFNALQALVEPIDDVHVSVLDSHDNQYSPGQPKGIIQELLLEFEAQTQVTDQDAYLVQELNKALTIIDDVYLDGDYLSAGGPTNDFYKWGFIGDEVGYLSIGAFITRFDQTIANQLGEIENIIDLALTDLKSTQALIIDVRLSPGGADPVALAIANRFADIERLAISKRSRSVKGEGISQEVYVFPSERVQYTDPVVILTSGFSASATETFLLAMRTLPQVSLVGEQTIGALSDILEKPLPNDWQVELANEVYFDANGFSYEAVGIQPDTQVSAFRKAERDVGQDSAINAALLLFGISL